MIPHRPTAQAIAPRKRRALGLCRPLTVPSSTRPCQTREHEWSTSCSGLLFCNDAPLIVSAVSPIFIVPSFHRTISKIGQCRAPAAGGPTLDPKVKRIFARLPAECVTQSAGICRLPPEATRPQCWRPGVRLAGGPAPVQARRRSGRSGHWHPLHGLPVGRAA